MTKWLWAKRSKKKRERFGSNRAQLWNEVISETSIQGTSVSDRLVWVCANRVEKKQEEKERKTIKIRKRKKKKRRLHAISWKEFEKVFFPFHRKAWKVRWFACRRSEKRLTPIWQRLRHWLKWREPTVVNVSVCVSTLTPVSIPRFKLSSVRGIGALTLSSSPNLSTLAKDCWLANHVSFAPENNPWPFV